MASKIYPKAKPNLSWKIIRKWWRYHKNARSSKAMLPCMRCVHLHKSASLKTMFNQTQKKHAKLIPKWTKIQFSKNQKIMWKHLERYLKYFKLPDVGTHLGVSCMAFSSGSASFSRPTFRNLWGVPPWTDSGLPWCTLGPILSILLQDIRSKFAPIFKGSRTTNCTNHTFNKNKQWFKKFDQWPIKANICYVCRLTKPRE